MPETHKCPAPGCNVDVPFEQFACRAHWYSLPKDLRDALWSSWNRYGSGSVEHADAMDRCITWLNGAADAPA